MTQTRFFSTKTTLFLSLFLFDWRSVFPAMKHYRPLLLQELDVRLPGLHIRRLRLNRHLPDVDTLARHAHAFAQIHYYLSGRGTMVIGKTSWEIGPGSAVFLPPRQSHGFEETAGRRPLCLVVDFDWRGAAKQGVSQARLGQGDAAIIRRELGEITRLPDPGHAESRMVVAGAVLHILDTLFRGLTILPPQKRESPALVRHFERELQSAGEPLVPIATIATRMGYQTDYLNRIFKQATGQTLREYRDALLVKKARRLLAEHRRVGEVCDRLGFSDQNYFSRWFKKYTGSQPRAYAAARSGG